ncbi:MAG: flagellar protein FlgN [Lachnospiraceae bacterium]|nr:flagellar protein FlgN [Lachnospiraceae bacterium]
MASLAGELLLIMQQEKKGYEALYDLAQKKRKAIGGRDLELLTQITDQENDIASDLKNLQNKRIENLKDMSVVLGHDDTVLTVTQVISLLSGQPDEQRALEKAKDDLVRAAKREHDINEQIQILLSHAMELTEFDMNLLEEIRKAPQTANYNRKAYNTGDVLPNGGFDLKQ